MLYKEKRYDDVIKVYRKLIQINNANKNKRFSFESAKLKNFFSLDSFRILADAMLLKVKSYGGSSCICFQKIKLNIDCCLE